MASVFFSLLMLIPSHVFAQSAALDSLFRLLSKTQDIPAQTDILTEIAYVYLANYPDSSLYFVNKAEKLIKQINDPKREALLINRKGLAYYDKGDLTQALFYLRSSLALSEKIADKNLIGRNLGNLAIVYLGIENYRLGIDYLQKALVIFKETNNKERIALTLNNLGNAYIELNEYDSAAYFLKEALPLTQKYAPLFLSFAHFNAGKIKLRQKQYKEAEQEARQALRLAQNHSDDLVYAYRLLAEIHVEEGNINLALTEVRKAIEVAEKSKRIRDLYGTYALCATILKKKQDLKNALYYEELSIRYRDTIQSENISKALQIFEYEQRQNEIARLKTEQVRQDIEYKQKIYRQQSFIYYAILALVFTLILSVVILRSRHRAKKSNIRLKTALRDIHEKHEEILTQNEEIRHQQEEINHLNQHLEELVMKKTETILERNAKLNDYAHFNAHTLRSPIATILGLYEVLKLTRSEEEKELILEKIKVTIEHLDTVVRKSQELLNDIEE